MTWHRGLSVFDEARRREAYRRFSRLVRRGEDDGLLELDELRRRLRLFEQTYVGIVPIRVDAIVGTAGPSEEFGGDFLPRRDDVGDRWRQLERAFPQGEFPPIVVYQVDEAYFVVDGHHRVAIAKQTGVEFIDADVTRLNSRIPIPPDVDVRRLIIGEQERMFMDESGLARARPEAVIEFSRPDGYVELLELVKVHGYHLMQERGEVLAPPEIAADWYDRVYLPSVEALKNERLDELSANATHADLFLRLWQRRRALHPESGSMSLLEAAKLAGKERPAGPIERVKKAVRKLTDGRRGQEDS